jgi:FkbM family methyltransferase
MSTRYIKGHEKVLEIGANIGRNTLVISSLLNDSSNLVTLECDRESYSKLIKNKNINGFHFHAENAALSARPLIQKDWDTIPSEILLEGYTRIKTITFPELKEKYQINFDTLVLDCEGAFYYILMDYPEILHGINLIIMENDYHSIDHKKYIDSVLNDNNFMCDYSEGGGWGPCETNFYEVWKLKFS